MIISELCQNWKGNVEILRDMVFESARCGARWAKVQSFFADDLTSSWKTEHYRLKGLELTWPMHVQFMKWCKEADILPMTTVYALKYLEPLQAMGFEWLKIGSPHCTNTVLIEACLKMGFKVVVATGGTHVDSLPSVLNDCYGVLHCVSKYPHTIREADMVRMLDLKRKFPNPVLGFSDHSDPLNSSWLKCAALARYLGGEIVERHFRILPANETKDGPVSISSNQLQELCELYKENNTQMINKYPDFGLFYFPKRDTEYKLISRYATRFKVD